jgi:hypothetical protein
MVATRPNLSNKPPSQKRRALMLFLIAALAAPLANAPIPDKARLTRAVRQAVEGEIGFVNSAIAHKNMDLYMQVVPDDYRIEEDDGTVTDKARLREKQTASWALIQRTNHIAVKVTDFKLGCGGACAFVKTDQKWDRQMIGRDGVTEFNVVTTQQHNEKWELRGSRWQQTFIEELGGTTMVDGKLY